MVGLQPAADAALIGRYYKCFADHAVAIARRSATWSPAWRPNGDAVRSYCTPALWRDDRGPVQLHLQDGGNQFVLAALSWHRSFGSLVFPSRAECPGAELGCTAATRSPVPARCWPWCPCARVQRQRRTKPGEISSAHSNLQAR